ncbi:O-fucosyltransferase 8 isoform X1 [Andrographis paniculata]|uniref:O-fucosyltransferase 8 isoform X1 n=2 Tax=Andrographis paniculata TaxID=175694 RepID=UPI0021E952EB|nr:O-fucosyltransferase 8 isoform X1 [Andrographis paniculata]
MGRQGSPKSSHPSSLNFDASFGLNESQLRWAELLQNGDPSIGRRIAGGGHICDKGISIKGLKYSTCKAAWSGKKQKWWFLRHIRSTLFTLILMSFLYLLDSLLYSIFDPTLVENSLTSRNSYDEPKEIDTEYVNQDKGPVMYPQLLNMASVSLAEQELDPKISKFWNEPYPQAAKWKPCADASAKRAGTVNNHTGFIMVSANGGLNQQRVAVCNAVAVAYLLNATLVIPKFLYSNVWKDPSQFGDIYQEDTFRNTLKHDINIVKELPSRLKLINLELVGSLVTDADLAKEATPDEYIKNILPILLRNGVVHFLGFGNRLGFDPLPAELQRLRCKCNFHALKFVPKIQKTGSLLLKRIRKHDTAMSVLDKQLIGSFVSSAPSEQHFAAESSAKYLALHLRFEVDMVAYSMCDFGGGDNERRELEAYREEHFPLLLERLKKTKPISPIELRKMGRCPLTPEEAALVLAGLGFNRGTYIYLAGSQIYGGKSRIFPISGLYPNLVTKEDLLSLDELAPFQNFSSQLAALDFIACAASDVFAMTDSGSQLSSLVSGFRTYYGGGNAPILRPSKKRLAAILQENSTITWRNFASRVRKMIEEGQRVHARSYGRSIYRQPRCKECMCRQP